MTVLACCCAIAIRLPSPQGMMIGNFFGLRVLGLIMNFTK
jgi:hypothetical protein